MGAGMGYAPVVPAAKAPRPAETDRQWIEGYRRRRAAERIAPYNRIAAAEALSANAGLSRTVQAMNDRHERRIAGRSRVDTMLADAALRNDIERYRRERTETLGLISRLRSKMDPYAGYAIRGSCAERQRLREITRAGSHRGHAVRGEEVTCPDCLAVGATAEQSYLIHADPDAPAGVALPPVAEPGQVLRVFPLEEHRVIRRAQGGDGRTVEAYAAVFGQREEIRDQMGHYFEENDPAAFDLDLAEARRSPGGLAGAVKVCYNHGMTRQGTPSDRWSLPVATAVDVRPDSRGLLTVARYTDDDVLDRIKSGALTHQSYVGACLRSSPELRRGQRYGADGTAPVVRRLRTRLREFGPVLWPAFAGAEIVGVRSA